MPFSVSPAASAVVDGLSKNRNFNLHFYDNCHRVEDA